MQIAFTSAGHETLAAINEELRAAEPRLPSDAPGDAPEISITEGIAGRETLALITEALQPARSAQDTLSYGDRISNAPGAKTPSRTPPPRTPPRASAPEIVIGETAVGRETLAAITAELATEGGAASPTALTPTVSTPSESPFAIFEMLTFVVQGPQTASLSSDALRRRFVEEHLIQRLPTKDMAQVERVDVTPWTVRGTIVVRVWCKL